WVVVPIFVEPLADRAEPIARPTDLHDHLELLALRDVWRVATHQAAGAELGDLDPVVDPVTANERLDRGRYPAVTACGVVVVFLWGETGFEGGDPVALVPVQTAPEIR